MNSAIHLKLIMIHLCTLFVLLTCSLWASYPSLPQPRTEEEALQVRRIVEFWRDKEYSLANAQIKNYLNTHANSPYTDHFLAMLGDIDLQNGAYSKALDHYDNIKGEELKKSVQLKKWQALYQMGMYDKLYQETAPQLSHLQEEGRFYFAESAFREALACMQVPEGVEEALSLCEEALPIYESLLESEAFVGHAKLGLAEIHRILNHPEKAAALYLEISAQDGNPEILFHAATVLVQCDKANACQIFEKIAHLDCPYTSDAAYQWLLLLAEKEKWEQILKNRALLTTHIAPDKLPICYFYLGLLTFERKEYAQAAEDLTRCVGKNLSPKHEKKALLALNASALALKQWDVCHVCFERLYEQFPEARADVCSLQIHALAGQKQFAAAHEALLNYLEAYPQSGKKRELLLLAIDLSIAEEAFDQLAEDIQRGMEAGIFDPEEKRAKEVQLAKAFLKTGNAEAALKLLKDIEMPDPLLMALAYIQEGSSPEKVVAFGEKALLASPNEKKLHLHLFNAYLELTKAGEDKGYTMKAAEHLSRALSHFSISLENRLWLAHYYVKYEPKKAIPILESLFANDAHLRRFDAEAFLLASLYLAENSLEKAEPLLVKIAQLEQKTKGQAELKLAEIYSAQGKRSEAKELFEKLEEESVAAIACAASLQLARLEFCEEPEKSLKKLHHLAVRKNLSCEPVHLEAALDFAELTASQMPEEARAAKLLELFVRVKDNFTTQEDICSKDYHASRELFPEKELVYQAYMRYLDARIYMLQAKRTHDPIDSKTKLNAARALLSTLRHGKYAVTTYIKQKALLDYEN